MFVFVLRLSASTECQSHFGMSQTFNSWVPDPEIKCIKISDAIFDHCSSPDNGGAIMCSVDFMSARFQSTQFHYCKTPGYWGGAMYFSSIDGQCEMNNIVVSDCFSNNGQFVFISLETDTGINAMNLTSITKSSPSKKSSGNNVFFLDAGKQMISLSNISNSDFYGEGAGGAFYGITKSIIQNCIFANHSTQTSLLTFFGGSAGEYDVSNTNYIKFSKESRLWAAIVNGKTAKTTFSRCTFKQIQNVMFQTLSVRFLFDTCALDKISSEPNQKNALEFRYLTSLSDKKPNPPKARGRFRFKSKKKPK